MFVTGEVTLGNLLIMVTVLAVGLLIWQRIRSIELIVQDHGLSLLQHSHRLDGYEVRLIETIEHVHTVIRPFHIVRAAGRE